MLRKKFKSGIRNPNPWNPALKLQIPDDLWKTGGFRIRIAIPGKNVKFEVQSKDCVGCNGTLDENFYQGWQSEIWNPESAGFLINNLES